MTATDPAHAWFTVGVSPASSSLYVEYTRGSGTHKHRAPALLLQHSYPVDANGNRIAGADWVDSRVVVGVVSDGVYLDPVVEVDPKAEAYQGAS